MLKNEREVDFVGKVAPSRLSLLMVPMLWLTYSICDKVELTARADVLCNVR